MAGDTHPNKKVITSCIYCSNPPNGQEHWLNRSLGKFAGNTFLTGRICTACNVKFGETIDRELVRTGHVGVTRQVLGIEGSSRRLSRGSTVASTSATSSAVRRGPG